MKTKLSFFFLILALCPVPCALSQIPQGFNYQAVARNASGVPLASQPLPVRMTIQSDSLGGTILWQELHSSVSTNPQGVINLVVGKGARESASTVSTFSNIDWTVTPKFLKTEINYNGWKTLGVSKLWSVPYAQVARDLDGPVKKLSVEGETSGLEEALFEVKNKDGQTVFAVYNEGVRVYVSDGAKALKGGFAVGGFGTDKAESTKYLFVGKDSVRIYLDTNPLTKGKKSGFAVGGYDLTKGTVQNYFDVSGDSVRIYIDSDPSTKKLKGGFAVGGYDMTKGTNTDYMNVNTDASGIIKPSQKRILWYPIKNAFLTGKVLIEDKDSVGENSFASGYESKSPGDWSQALGYKAIARGDYSTAIGKNAVANKSNSFAFGDSATAKNSESYAIGRGALASGYRSFAFGSAGIDSAGIVTDVAHASGDYSFAIGQGSQSLGLGSFSIGLADSAKGDYSVSLGYQNIAEGNYSIALGRWARALGGGSMAFRGEAIGGASIAFMNCQAIGNASVAIGNSHSWPGLWGYTYYYSTQSVGDYSFAIGKGVSSSGKYSTAMGFLTKSHSAYETVVGTLNSDYTPQSTSDWNQSDRLFVIGNGYIDPSYSWEVKSNAMTVLKNGNVGIGTSTPNSVLHIKGNAGILNLEGSDHCYIGWYPDGLTYGRKGYFGFPGAAVNDIVLSNEIATGNIVLIPGSSGKLGVGTSSPANLLSVHGTRSNTINSANAIARIGGADVFIHFGVLNGTPNWNTWIQPFRPSDDYPFGLLLCPAGGYVGIGTSTPGYRLTVNGTAWCSAGAWTGSDLRWKENFLPLSNVMPDIQSLMPVSYDLKIDEFPHMGFEDGRQIGLIAQDVEKIFPELVRTDNNGFKSVSYEKLSVVLLEAIKEQQQQIETQNQKIDQLIVLIEGLKGEIASSLRSSQ